MQLDQVVPEAPSPMGTTHFGELPSKIEAPTNIIFDTKNLNTERTRKNIMKNRGDFQKNCKGFMSLVFEENQVWSGNNMIL